MRDQAASSSRWAAPKRADFPASAERARGVGTQMTGHPGGVVVVGAARPYRAQVP